MGTTRAAHGLLGAGLVALAAGLLMLRSGPSGQVGIVATPAPGRSPAPVAGGVVRSVSALEARPVRLRLAGAGTASPVVPVVVGAAGSLGVPEDPSVLGWWSGGAAPGAGRGSIVVDGHVDSARFGIGVFAQLRRLGVGDRIEVFSSDGRTQRYAVTGRRHFDKTDLPAAVFDQNVGERLVLITCGGHFDQHTRHYSQNIVLYAIPVNGNS